MLATPLHTARGLSRALSVAIALLLPLGPAAQAVSLSVVNQELQQVHQGPIPAQEPEYRLDIPQGSFPAGKEVAGRLAIEQQELRDGKQAIGPEQEVVSERTRNTKILRAASGSTRELQSVVPLHYQEEGVWKDIDTTLRQTREGVWETGSNSWTTRFSGMASGAVTLIRAGQEVRIRPDSNVNVAPVVSGKAPHQEVRYPNVWEDVDLVYQVSGAEVKEYIVVKTPEAARQSFRFTYQGTTLTPAGGKGGHALSGAFADAVLMPPTVANLTGTIQEGGTAVRQQVEGSEVTVSFQPVWLGTVAASDYPLIIDPTTYLGPVEYASIKSDGYVCWAGMGCGNAVGELNTSSGWRAWRHFTRANYSSLAGKYLLAADLNFAMVPPGSVSYRGTPDLRNYWARAATSWTFGGLTDSYGVTTSQIAENGWISVLPQYRQALSLGDYGMVLAVNGEETPGFVTYKFFDPYYTFTSFLYTSYPNSAVPTGPANGGKVVTLTPALTASAGSDPDGDTLLYRFKLATAADSGSVTYVSGWNPTPSWTVPDDLLADGRTYHWFIQTWDQQTPDHAVAPATSVNSSWQSFTVDLRQGKDATQAYDTVGPVSIDLATGNLTTGTGSHSTTALGGAMGVSLEYNTPIRAREGLTGEYWNCAVSFCGTPTTQATVVRTDAKLDFAWQGSGPAPGQISADLFIARYTGYFVAPSTGTFEFGAVADDGVQIVINNQLLLNQWYYQAGTRWGSGISLQEGQVVPVHINFMENYGNATFQVRVRGAVADQVVPTQWWRTAPRSITQKGLTASYYHHSGDYVQHEQNLFMRRVDATVDFQWGNGAPVPGGPTDKFLVRWTGYFTAPSTGTYKFGSSSDDAMSVNVNGVDTVPWPRSGTFMPATGMSLTAGQTVPVNIFYAEYSAGAFAQLRIDGPGFNPNQPVAPGYFTTGADVLPRGWSLNVDADGSIPYDYATVQTNGVTLHDASGSRHEYKWTGSAYTPPVDEGGTLVRNANGTLTLQDLDGRTYNFGTDGTLSSVTIPQDDLRPAALQYSYAGTPTRLTQVTDATDSQRWAKLHYGGGTQCGTIPSGFVTPPSGMLCALQTYDGRVTQFLYATVGSSVGLARVLAPGGQQVDYGYDTNGLLIQVRDALANDVVSAGVRANDATVLTQVTYDVLGRATGVTAPAATAGATRQQDTYHYRNSHTLLRVVGNTEPHGFSRKVAYDALYRTTSETDLANQTSTTVWDPIKDLVLKTTSALGQTSTTIYDQFDRPVTSYGPAPDAWFGANRQPLAAHVANVPTSTRAYDEGMGTLAAAYYQANTFTPAGGTQTRILSGAPLAHTTGLIGGTQPLKKTWGSSSPAPGVTISGNGWGTRLTGWIRLDAIGRYEFNVGTDDGVRLRIGDQVILNDWTDGGFRYRPHAAFTTTEAGKWHRISIEYYTKSGSEGDARLEMTMNPPGQGPIEIPSTVLKPDYGLVTSASTPDSHAAVADSTVVTSYGTRPELGLVQSLTLNPTGANYTSSSTYEPEGQTGTFLRQTSKTLPGGTTTIYAHYVAGETRDNPCTPAVEFHRQGGAVKLRTEPDPDGAGSQTGRVTETVYDDAGRVVATRYNSDAWTCTTYDARGRTLTTVVPAFNGQPGRTITNEWAVGSNPLITRSGDASGTITTTIDLLGRTVSYVDALGYTTTYQYSDLGLLTQRSSILGTETFSYDTQNRLTEQKLGTQVLATLAYNASGQLASVTYPELGQTLTYERDVLQRVKAIQLPYTTGTLRDEVTFSQSGKVVSSLENGVSKSYTFDDVGRLTAATIGSNQFTYSFAAPVGCAAPANQNAHKNSNRTGFSSTVNGVSTSSTACYGAADQILSSTDPLVGVPVYDAHGNTTQMGVSGSETYFTYDASDRPLSVSQASGESTSVSRDVQGRVTLRTEAFLNEEAGEELSLTARHYAYTTSSDTPDALVSGPVSLGGVLVEGYVELPGNMQLTVPAGSLPGGIGRSYALSNLHGDTMAKLAPTGTVGTSSLSGTFLSGPFGETITGTLDTRQGADPGYLGSYGRFSESHLALTPVFMGARLYLPSLGRFTSIDPVEGGTPSAYVYPTDPVNEFDTDGSFDWSFKNLAKVVTNVASVAALIPGPIGMIASGVVVAGELAQGNYAAAAIAAVGLTGMGAAAGTLTKMAAKHVAVGGAGKLLTSVHKGASGLARFQAGLPGIGRKSGAFRNVGKGASESLLNRRGSLLKIGWSGMGFNGQRNTVFRIGIGRKAHSNASRYHIDLLVGSMIYK